MTKTRRGFSSKANTNTNKENLYSEYVQWTFCKSRSMSRKVAFYNIIMNKCLMAV